MSGLSQGILHIESGKPELTYLKSPNRLDIAPVLPYNGDGYSVDVRD